MNTELEFKMSASLAPSGGSKGETISCLSPSFQWLKAICHSPWLVDAWLHSSPPFSHYRLLCLPVLSLRTLVIAFKTYFKSRKILFWGPKLIASSKWGHILNSGWYWFLWDTIQSTMLLNLFLISVCPHYCQNFFIMHTSFLLIPCSMIFITYKKKKLLK